MMTKSQNHNQMNLFRAHFNQILDPKHPLIKLADKIDWERFDVALTDCYSPDFGSPAKSTRLMVGMIYLKHTFDVSDENLPKLWVENPYWQYFCGFSFMQHEMPFEYTTLIKWRKRVGYERLKELLRETIDLALREKQVDKRELRSVNVDTTVQEKNVTCPTDSKLLFKAIEKLGQAAKDRGIKLRQSYIKVGKRLMIKASRYAHARQSKRMRRELRKLKTIVGRLIRDICRKAGEADASLSSLLELCDRVRTQERNDKNKLYSLHEPHVQCISKGKAHKRYEFGCKVSVVTTNKNSWVLCADALEGNPYDGHTLVDAIRSAESISSVGIKEAFADKGYRGHDYKGEASVHLSGIGKVKSEALRKRKKRRSAIEPKIGHMKADNRMGRCFLKGAAGDAVNALLAGVGANMRKLLNALSFCDIFLQLLSGVLKRQAKTIDQAIPGQTVFMESQQHTSPAFTRQNI